MLLRKTILLTCALLIVGCSKEVEKKELESINDQNVVDWSVLKEDQQFSVQDYEMDSSARVYVLGECAKLVAKGEQTPIQCENAALAEYNELALDLDKNEAEDVRMKLSKEDRGELKETIIKAHTFKKI